MHSAAATTTFAIASTQQSSSTPTTVSCHGASSPSSCADHSSPQCCHCGWRGSHSPNCPFSILSCYRFQVVPNRL
ncbi:hypothetical protein GALMADRAFT_393053 [Galerina marginata CBS 339.88]|uniref:Uncharacterized protein n=1 Tax=Galerina marginata (strain CBS 339.88) TaxID=685588 RepID=A0A067U3C5_GALM3|nr:hypothetical protein GALMADRAFT_393053 [Galerina marginata CBS 339.88]